MRWIVRIFAALLTLVILAGVAVLMVPAERVAELAASRIEAATGRAVVIEAPVRPAVWPQLGVSTGPVRLAGPGWAREGEMFAAEALAIRLDMAALIGGETRITAIEARAPRIVIERGADGRLNWEMEAGSRATGDTAAGGPGSGAGGAGGPSVPRGFGLDRLIVSDGRLIVIDHAGGSRTEISDLTLEAKVPDIAGRAELAASGRLGGSAFTLEAATGALAGLLAGEIAPLEASLALGASRIGFAGRAGIAPLQAEGRLDAGLRDLAALARALGQQAPDLPEGLGRREIGLAGQVTLAPAGSLHLRDGALTLDGNRLTLAADLTPDSPRPRLAARVSAGTLNLAALGGDGGGGGGGTGRAAEAQAGWSQARIDATALHLLDADVTLSASAIDLGRTRIGATSARLALDAGRAVLDIAEAAVSEGRVSGQLVANARSGFSARADLRFEAVALQPLLRDFADYDRLITAATGQVNLLGVGDSMDALMRSLSGEGQVALGGGELRGLDIAGMLRNLDPGFVGEGQRTIFDAVTASFTVANGVLRNDDLAMQAPLLRATGAGRVDIGARTLDYRITPTALGREDGGGGVRVPLAITGRWDAPRFRLDLEAIAGDRIETERARLEERAREELARQAERELGIVAEEGERLEDAARRRLEREAERGLRRLLGGN